MILHMNISSRLLLVICLGCCGVMSRAVDTTSISFDTGGLLINNSNNSSILSGGTTADGDGTVVQIGYYSSATSGNLFSGTWTALAGAGTSNYSTLSIGDFNVNGGANGELWTGNLVFTAGPVGGQILSVRFYNNTSLATSTYYATVSNANWTWIAPSPTPSPLIWSAVDSGSTWEGGFTAYTGIAVSAVPEPATYAALFGVASLGFCVWRKRRKA